MNIGGFLTKMLGDSNEVSHKRLISLLSFLCLVVCLIFNIRGKIIDQNILYVFATLCAGNSAMTVVDKIFKKDSSTTITPES
jgi:hypothetical protein